MQVSYPLSITFWRYSKNLSDISSEPRFQELSLRYRRAAMYLEDRSFRSEQTAPVPACATDSEVPF